MSNIGCLIFWYDARYDFMGEVACRSFQKFHPDITLFRVDRTKISHYQKEFDTFLKHGAELVKFAIAYSIMKVNNLSKIIILGADTITLDRLSEFIDNNNHDILTTLDYKYACHQNSVLLSTINTHYNPDVVCFNNVDSLLQCIKNSIPFGKVKSSDENLFCEQGGLNYTCNIEGRVAHHCVDNENTNICYNVKSKGSVGSTPNMIMPGNQFKVSDDKVFTSNGLQIKVWHYCSGFGVREDWQGAYYELNRDLGSDFCNFVKQITELDITKGES